MKMAIRPLAVLNVLPLTEEKFPLTRIGPAVLKSFFVCIPSSRLANIHCFKSTCQCTPNLFHGHLYGSWRAILIRNHT